MRNLAAKVIQRFAKYIIKARKMRDKLHLFGSVSFWDLEEKF
jgi:hypothetical protein